jgi:hypothetical protein
MILTPQSANEKNIAIKQAPYESMRFTDKGSESEEVDISRSAWHANPTTVIVTYLGLRRPRPSICEGSNGDGGRVSYSDCFHWLWLVKRIKSPVRMDQRCLWNSSAPQIMMV